MQFEDFNSIMDSSVSEENTANPIGTESNRNLSYSLNCEIMYPANTKNYTITSIGFEKVKEQCNKKHKFSPLLSELLLSLSMLFLGAFISAFLSKITFEGSFIPILFYCASPTLGFTCLALFFLARNVSIQSENKLQEKVMEYIIEPIETMQKEQNNEH